MLALLFLIYSVLILLYFARIVHSSPMDGGHVVYTNDRTTMINSSSSFHHDNVLHNHNIRNRRLIGGGYIQFSYTGSNQTWIVPDGIYYITIQAYGGKGGDFSSSCTGGYGGYASGILQVTPGETIYVYVGGSGTTVNSYVGYCAFYSGGWNGGGGSNSWGDLGTGGGASDIRLGGTSLSNRIIVAGGGGGCTDASYESGSSTGAGGGLTGQNGGYTDSSYPGGGGGSQTSGGAAGTSPNGCTPQSAGSLGVGGNGGGYYHGGGGGGGGYYGGGGGGHNEGGGGGSSYIDGVLNGQTTSGVNAGNGYIIISYDATPTSQPSKQPSSQPVGQPTSQPSRQPFSQPSKQPTSQPVGKPTSQPSSQPTSNPTLQPFDDIEYLGGNNDHSINTNWYMNHTFSNLGLSSNRVFYLTTYYYPVGYIQTTTINFYTSSSKLVCACTITGPSSCGEVFQPCCYNQKIDGSTLTSLDGGSLEMQIYTSNNANVDCIYNNSQLYVKMIMTIDHGSPTLHPTIRPTSDSNIYSQSDNNRLHASKTTSIYIEIAIVVMLILVGGMIVNVRSTDHIKNGKVGEISYVGTIMKLSIAGYSTVSQIVLIYIFFTNSSSSAMYGITILFAKLILILPISITIFQYYNPESDAVRRLLDEDHLLHNSKLYAIVIMMCLFDSTLIVLLPWRKTVFYEKCKGYPSLSIFRISMYPKLLSSSVIACTLLLFNMNSSYFGDYTSMDVVLYFLGLAATTISLLIESFETIMISNAKILWKYSDKDKNKEMVGESVVDENGRGEREGSLIEMRRSTTSKRPFDSDHNNGNGNGGGGNVRSLEGLDSYDYDVSNNGDGDACHVSHDDVDNPLNRNVYNLNNNNNQIVDNSLKGMLKRMFMDIKNVRSDFEKENQSMREEYSRLIEEETKNLKEETKILKEETYYLKEENNMLKSKTSYLENQILELQLLLPPKPKDDEC
jgi:hypothetical protein